jgi:hypothetical protein
MAESQQETMTQLGLFGLIPLAAGAAGAWASPWLIPGGLAYGLSEVSLIYSAVVASYIVGVGAGGALSRNAFSLDAARTGMIAALVAWLAAWPPGVLFITLPDILRYAIMILVFAFLLLRDLRAVAAGALPQWYGGLRTRLTFWASLLLAAMMARLIV